MNEDFSNVNLFLSEKYKLFVMRFKKEVSSDFLGESAYQLTGIKFITSKYPFSDLFPNDKPNKTVYSLTTRYWRYCVWKRNHLIDKLISSIVIPIFVSLATSLLVLKLQELIELLER